MKYMHFAAMDRQSTSWQRADPDSSLIETADTAQWVVTLPDDNETDSQKHHLLFAIEDGDEDLIDEFDLQEFGLRRVEDEYDDRLVVPIDETEPVIEDEVDRISHGTPDSHIETPWGGRDD